MKTLVALAALLTIATAAAQPSGEAFVKGLLAPYPAVEFAAQPLENVPVFGSLSNVTIKPQGDGPFPAVVLVHTCGGIGDAHMGDHAREMLAAGYVVTLQDSFGPRSRANCGPNNSQALVSVVGANDAYAALGHLRKLAFVDPERIYLAGYSWGGMTAQLMANPQMAKIVQAPGRFRASVANYTGCFDGSNRPFLRLNSLDRPVLLLLGGKDTETPAAKCVSNAQELQAAGLPVQFHVFPDATHAWDKLGQRADGYVYDASIAKDATQRMLRFFEANR